MASAKPIIKNNPKIVIQDNDDDENDEVQEIIQDNDDDENYEVTSDYPN